VMLDSSGANRLVADLFGSMFGNQNMKKLRSISKTKRSLVHHHHGRIMDRFNDKKRPLACKRKS
jgi:hypothetical protein